MARTKKSHPKLSKRQYLVGLVALLVILSSGAALAWHNSQHKGSPAAVTPDAKAASVAAESTPAVSGAASGQQYAATGGDNNSPSGQLPAPTGELLNLHTISLSADPAMESVCSTIADATCTIKLTSGSTIKSAGSQSTGSSGEVLFNWAAQDIGLSVGQWTVQAVVTQYGQTGYSATDTLTVNP